ncbi:MAG: DUF4450 domain-containing protein, partial [Verrucomicrobiae bacterium]|nr:DUF4450 domain-containing protein [Verrucomicrobiae bacterium]
EDHKRARPMLKDNLDRPLRYKPDGGDFVIVNGAERFNRPLYGDASIFRVDAGDRPEFSFYVPGRGGNLRLAVMRGDQAIWLDEAAVIEARYRAGMMIYRIGDPKLGKQPLELSAIATRGRVGFLLELKTPANTPKAELLLAFGGADGELGGRGGDIGCEDLPSREFFAFQPNRCKGNTVTAAPGTWSLKGKRETVTAVLPEGTPTGVGDGQLWSDATKLAASLGTKSATPLALARLTLKPNSTLHLGFFRESKPPGGDWSAAGLAKQFEAERDFQIKLANRVRIDTPDPFINAAMPALNIAADAVWDEKAKGFLHGAVAWRMVLLGWRVPYGGDALGWHERTRAHFERYAKRQNTKPIPDKIPGPDKSQHLARSMDAIHSNGDLTNSAYDMNTVAVDTILRHLMWTGDLDYARSVWPVLERHMAWSKRMFRREFGPEKLPLYEAYCMIWASDDLAYHGGGTTHGSAYALFQNRQMARLAKLLGKDGSAYEKEAELIGKGMRQQLWLKDRGWFAEWKDLLGEGLVHPEAAAWSYYHTLDSEVPTPIEAWQMGRAVETRLPHFPVRGPGVPAGAETIATSTWMPYQWSLNNVVMAETLHTALALWQAGRDDHAQRLFHGAILDSMYLGICPGNVGMTTWYDVNRRESQRDFSDPTGVMSRAIVEGLFGVRPDLLAGKIDLNPRIPADWGHASIHHPSFDLNLKRDGAVDRYIFKQRFAKTLPAQMVIEARADRLAKVTVNGKETAWKPVPDAVGSPRVHLTVPAAAESVIELHWSGSAPAKVPAEIAAKEGAAVTLAAGAKVLSIEDPQGALKNAALTGDRVTGTAVGTPGHRTVFAKVRQDAMEWWQPLALRIDEAKPAPQLVFTTDWAKPSKGKHEPLKLDGLFNEDLNKLFKREYLSPRSPFPSLAIPKQGFGSWCHPRVTFHIDDSGLRATAAKNSGKLILPNGVPIATATEKDAQNIAIVSQWDNHPRHLSVPMSGRAQKLYLLMAGSTNGMQSRFDNAELMIAYKDGSQTRLALDNPGTWWPIHTDYFIDDHAFRRPGPLPLRVDLKSGKIRVLDEKSFVGTVEVIPGGAGKAGNIPGGAATVLDVKLDPTRELESLTVRAIANEVLVGLMGATLER